MIVVFPFMESIKSVLASSRSFSEHVLTKGKNVRMVSVPLSGAIGSVIRRKGKNNHLVIAIELLQRSVAVEFEDDRLELCQ
jgi:hypothetical protein